MRTAYAPSLLKALTGCLLGTAVGDALGLPAEGLSRQRQNRLLGQIGRHRFLFGCGMVSDDTEHTCMAAQALLTSAGDAVRFERELARQLRRWLLLLPAGVGLATLKATTKLLVGVPPSRSGVYSAGNGPAMRSALLGICYGDDPERLRAVVRACTRITHTDPKAEHGAFAVALAAYLSARGEYHPACFLEQVSAHLADADGGNELLALVEQATRSAARGEDTLVFAQSNGLNERVSGYVYHTVPVALQAWMRHPADFRAAVRGVIACGGDTDTTAAIVGGIIGAGVGKEGIPSDWLSGLAEWPRDVAWMERLGERLAAVVASGLPDKPLPLPIPALAARNGLFLGTVLYHGLRRMQPPY